MRAQVYRCGLLVCLVVIASLSSAERSTAAVPSAWWHLNTMSEPTNLKPGTNAVITFTAANLGDGAADGLIEPVHLVATLPPGLTATSMEGLAGHVGRDGPVTCNRPTLTCTFASSLPAYDEIEVRVGVFVKKTATSAEAVEVSLSGGGASGAKMSHNLVISGEPTGFGSQAFVMTPEEEGGAPDTRAASHPFQLSSTVSLNQGTAGLGPTALFEVEPAAELKDLRVKLPPGLIGNVVPFPTCSIPQFSEYACPSQSVLGVAIITYNEPRAVGLQTETTPIYNLEPAFGEPARFGFLPSRGIPVYLHTGLRDGQGEDYGVTVSSINTLQTVGFTAATLTFWGTPGDPRHDNSRGQACLEQSRGGKTTEPCSSLGEHQPPAFQTLVDTCGGAPRTQVEADSWENIGAFEEFASVPLPTPNGCNRVPFLPGVVAESTSKSATSPTGLNFDLNFGDEGLLNSEGLAESNLKKAVVTLPEGFTTNPSVAEGLKACPQSAYEGSTLDGSVACPEESKIGEVEIVSPLVKPVVKGSLFVAKQGENPYGNLLTIYLVARNPELGVIVKQALKVVPDPVTGQLTTEVDDAPELPFSHFHLSFRQGQRAPLITPPACGEDAVKALLYPWARPEEPVERTSAFQITSGPEGQGCPAGGTPPFHPLLEAGTISNAAGSYSPFYARISRKDSEQEITHFSIKLPPGLSGKLAGVAECSDAQIAAAKSREHEGGGAEELEHPSCPAGSEIGHTVVGTGVGNVLAYAPGKLYLAGPYKGSNLSIVSITAAKVGPFDLGTVVIREALKINPETAQVSAEGAGSDPIPHIVDGIPVHLRDIRIYVDRKDFTLNPTSCARMSTASTVLGSGTNFASEADDQPVTVTSPFQAASCASLGFKPKLELGLKGSTKRGGLPKLTAVVTYPKGGTYANIAKTVVTLPRSEFLEQGHIGSSCTRVQFNEGGGNGERCPKNSLLGHAKAITPLLEEPIEGPVYLRSNGGERKLPDLVAALHSKDININLVGFISSLHKKGSEVSQIQNTFATVPDAPVEKFTLELLGGKKGLLVNSQNICKGTHNAISEFTGQNGKLYDTEPVVSAQCGRKGKGKQGAKKSGSKKK